MDSVCRLVFQLGPNKQVGHLGVVTDSNPERGILCELVTLSKAAVDGESQFWLPHSERGLAWDWLRDVRIRVSYLEDEDSSEPTIYEASVIDVNVQDFVVRAEFSNGDEPEWVSLIEDDWSWNDCDAPDKDVLHEAAEEAEHRALLVQRAHAAEEVNAKLYLMPSPAPLPVSAAPDQRQPKKQKRQSDARISTPGNGSQGSQSRGNTSSTKAGGGARGGAGGPVMSTPTIDYGTVRDWSGGRLPVPPPPPLTSDAELVHSMSLAVRALSSESMQELSTATQTLFEASSDGGAVSLVALLELKALPLLCGLIRRAIIQLEKLDEQQGASLLQQHAPPTISEHAYPIL